MSSDDVLAELQDDWTADLELALSEQVARTFAAHFIADLENRYQVRARRKPRTPVAKR